MIYFVTLVFFLRLSSVLWDFCNSFLLSLRSKEITKLTTYDLN